MEKIIGLFFPVLAFLLLFAGCCSAAEYRITGEEMTKLERNLTELQQRSEKREQRLKELEERLELSQSELEKLNQQLALLTEKNSETGSLLESANRSLSEYEREEKRVQRRLRSQRTVAYSLSCILLLALVAK